MPSLPQQTRSPRWVSELKQEHRLLKRNGRCATVLSLQEEEDATRSQAKEYGARKESTTTKTGLYNEQSDEESSPNSSSQEEDTEYQVQDNVSQG